MILVTLKESWHLLYKDIVPCVESVLKTILLFAFILAPNCVSLR